MRLGKVAVIATMILGLGKLAHAQSRCEISASVRGCVKSLSQLAKEQEKNEQKLGAININKSFKTLISEVNGKQLSYTHPLAGTYTLKVDASDSDVRVLINGKRVTGASLCYEVCSNEDVVTWYHPEQGVIKRIKRGLSINGTAFLMSRQ